MAVSLLQLFNPVTVLFYAKMKGLLSLGTAFTALMTAHAASNTPLYKNPHAAVEARVSDLLKRMSPQEKMSQLIQGDMRDYINEETGKLNRTGLEWGAANRGHAVWTGIYAQPEMIKKAAKIAQDYHMNETKLGQRRINHPAISISWSRRANFR